MSNTTIKIKITSGFVTFAPFASLTNGRTGNGLK